MHAQSLKVGVATYKAPFVFTSDGIAQGLEIDIVRSALNYKGHSINKILFMSYSRLQLSINKHYAHALVGVTPPAVDDGTFYSDPYIAFENYAISFKDDHINLTQLEDIKAYSLVAWQHAYQHLGEIFSEIYAPDATIEHQQYSEFYNQQEQVAFFLRKRADIIVIDKNIFYWQLKSFLADEKMKRYHSNVKDKAFTFYSISAEPTELHVNFSDEQLKDDFNEGLKALHASGDYQRIVDKYK